MCPYMDVYLSKLYRVMLFLVIDLGLKQVQGSRPRGPERGLAGRYLKVLILWIFPSPDEYISHVPEEQRGDWICCV